jgi:nucleotide-binding universal stress UspA family protein
MKNVLLLVHDDAGEEARLQAALDLTRALSGHLTCFDIVQMPVIVGSDFDTGGVMGILLDQERETEAENKARLLPRLNAEDVRWNWINATGDIGQLLARNADFADIIVTNSKMPAEDGPDMMSVASQVVMGSGRPVLAVPEGTRRLDAAGHVMIAWNGSAPVIETMRAAVPLLALAQTVTLLVVGDISGAPAEEAAAYLSRHGIHARIERDRFDASAADRILEFCVTQRPGYCLLGAYGHSRVRERIFGGVTRRLLAESPVPLILGH